MSLPPPPNTSIRLVLATVGWPGSAAPVTRILPARVAPDGDAVVVAVAEQRKGGVRASAARRPGSRYCRRCPRRARRCPGRPAARHRPHRPAAFQCRPAQQDIVAVAAFERDLRCQRPRAREASMMSSPPTPLMWMVSPASKCSTTTCSDSPLTSSAPSARSDSEMTSSPVGAVDLRRCPPRCRRPCHPE